MKANTMKPKNTKPEYFRSIPFKSMKCWLSVMLLLAHVLLAPKAFASLPIERWTTSHGTTVMWMRAEALPMLDIRVEFRAGNRFDTQGKEGLSAMTAGLIGKGARAWGALPAMDENQITDAFADVGAVFGASSNEDTAGVQLRTLTSQAELDKALSTLKHVLHAPSFDATILNRERSRSVAGLKDALTKPGVLAERAFSSAIYPQHPYGMLETEQSLNNITHEDVLEFHKSHYTAKGAVIAIVGPLDRTTVTKLAEELSSGLNQNNAPVAKTWSLSELQEPLSGNTIQIAHPATQSHILMGLPALSRNNPEFFDLLVANHILGGGGFVSRLMNEVREKRGLAYSTYSYFSPLGDAGPFQAGVQTKREQTQEAIAIMRQTIEQFIQQGPTKAELKAAKDNLIGGFPLRIDSNGKLLSNIAMMGAYQLPVNYLDTWTARIEAVTVKSAHEAMKKHIPLNKLTTIVVGGTVGDDTVTP